MNIGLNVLSLCINLGKSINNPINRVVGYDIWSNIQVPRKTSDVYSKNLER